MPRWLVLCCVCVAASAAVATDGYDEVGRAGFGAFIVPVPLSVQAERGLQPGQGGLVVGIRPGSTADQLGLRPGEVVLTINDRPVSNRGDVRTVVRGSQPGDAVAVDVMSDRGARTATGEFVARQPRPPGGWQGWFPAGQDPGVDWWNTSSPSEQYEELFTEIAALQAAAADLEAVRGSASVQALRSWFIQVDFRVREPARAPPCEEF
jgi:hypothetical protein